jgi:molecular chaperone DnaK
MNVTAQDRATGKEQKITITASTNMSKSEVERKVQEAQRYEAEDRGRRELIQARNTADQMIYQTEKTLGELDGQVPEADRAAIRRTIEDLKRVKDSDDTPRIQQLAEQLQQARYAIGQQMYAQQAAAQQAAAQQPGAQGSGGGFDPGRASYRGGSPAGGDDGGEFVDGEFRDV